jgi:hypothetical protein
VLVLALAGVVVVFALGGFELRSDDIEWLEPGAEADAGNLVFRFSRATAQYRTSEFSDPSWEVICYGEVRNPHSENLALARTSEIGNVMAVWGDTPGARKTEADFSYTVDGVGSRRVLPDNQWSQLEVHFQLGEDFSPEEQFGIATMPMVFGEWEVWSLGSADWHLDVYGTRRVTVLPLTVLPPAES